jgi:hypothetical protein
VETACEPDFDHADSVEKPAADSFHKQLPSPSARMHRLLGKDPLAKDQRAFGEDGSTPDYLADSAKKLIEELNAEPVRKPTFGNRN